MKRPSALLLLLLTAGSAAGLHSQASEGVAPASSALEAGLSAIRPAQILADIRFLACDEMRGRETPSPELRIAARFIRARLARLGFEAAGTNGWFFEYPLELRRLDAGGCGATIEAAGQRRELVLGRDYFHSSSRALSAADLGGTMVWCGDGTQEDFDSIAGGSEEGSTDPLAGCWAVCQTSDGEPTRRQRTRARRAGALGVLFIEAQGTSFKERYGAATADLLTGRVRLPRKKPRSSRTPYPQVFLSNAAFGRGGDGIEVGTEIGSFREVRALPEGGEIIQTENVCGLWRGSDAELAKDVILVTAHYDHIGMGGFGSMARSARGQVHNGADDNGSGSAGLLALAEGLRVHGPLKRSVLLMWVSGEEKGLWGSHAWATNPHLPEGMTAVANINVDMIGRNAPDELYITPSELLAEEYNNIVRLAEDLAASEGFPALGNADEFYRRSDQYEFAKMGMPVAFLHAGEHEDYHRPGDDVEKIDEDKVGRVMRLVLRILDRLQEGEISQ